MLSATLSVRAAQQIVLHVETHFQPSWDSAVTLFVHVETLVQQKRRDHAVTCLLHVETYFQQKGWDNAVTFVEEDEKAS